MNRSIGGALTHSAYALLAQRHRPNDAEVFAREAKQLATQGLSARDIAIAMTLSEAAVLQLLNEKQGAA